MEHCQNLHCVKNSLCVVDLCEFVGQSQFDDLQEAYLQRRRRVAQRQRQKQKVHETIVEKDEEVNSGGSDRYCSGLNDFHSVLTAFTRYRYTVVL